VGWFRRVLPQSAELDAHQGVGQHAFQQSHDERDRKSPPSPETGPMSKEITLDVRGMEPPEPLERVLQAIDGFVAGDRLTVVIDCRPQPLYRILERNGFAFCERPGASSLCEITIWRKE
jgi:uncharacterized protein (DUF2249 family)